MLNAAINRAQRIAGITVHKNEGVENLDERRDEAKGR